MRGHETIVIKPAGGLDDDGDPKAPGDPVTVEGCIIWPRRSSEEQGGVIIEGYNVFIPPGNPGPTATDRVNARGKDWAVDGVPGEFKMGGRDKGILVVLKRVGA